MKLLWTEHAWRDYVMWQEADKQGVEKVNRLLQDVQRSPLIGLGKPEPLAVICPAGGRAE